MSLPVLSYATAHSDPPEFIHQLQHALLTTGFLYLSDVDHVLPEWKMAWDEAFRSSAEFFAQDIDMKKEIGMIHSRHFRGYSAYGVEVTQGRHDLREQIDFGPDTDPAVEYPPAPGTPIERNLYGPNQYPSSAVPGLEPAIRHWRSLCDSISFSLVTLMAQSLTPDPSLLTTLFETDPARPSEPAYSRMKIVRYPPVQPGDDGLGVGAHKDGGGLTLLAQDQTGGLQVQLWTGQWIDIEPIQYSLVINVGERFTGGLYAATTHRVLPTRSSTPRISIPFFFCPRLNATVPVLSPSQIHPELLELATRTAGKADKISEVKPGDLHEELFGLAAWRGITRSHGDVWQRYYGRHMDKIGGPEPLAA